MDGSNTRTQIISVDNVAYYPCAYKYSSIQRLNHVGKMHGARRVIIFCLLTAVLPTALIMTPLYLRHSVYADVSYAVAESDVLEIRDGISSVFCQKQTLKMNSSFNAFQIHGIPETSKNRKHIKLKKSMALPDDTLEYWGFYLMAGATVALKVCSRFEGASILVVEGSRNLETCGLLEHNKDRFGAHMAKEHTQVRVTFDSPAQEILDTKHINDKKNGNKMDDSVIKESTTENEDVNKILKNSFMVAARLSNNKSQSNNNNNTKTEIKKTVVDSNTENSNSDTIPKHRKRHAKSRSYREEEINKLSEILNNEDDENERTKRELESAFMLDRGIEHGGNAANYTNSDQSESSVSSFENALLTCYDGKILLSKEFPPTDKCTSVHFLDSGKNIMQTFHEVTSNGYYYYIFYSDNDLVSNDIHAIFDIYKPTLQYANLSENKGCSNQTECSFPIPFWSSERVIVEVPTRDGIEHEEDDITILISTCQPRMSIYVIFPVAVLFLILVCAFL